MTNWQFLINLNTVCHFTSRERKGYASNSELKRWLINKAVIINGERAAWEDDIKFPIISFVLFPRKTVTIW